MAVHNGITFRGYYADPTSQATYTFTDIPIGTESADRAVLVAVAQRTTNIGGTQYASVVTCNGVTLSRADAQSVTGISQLSSYGTAVYIVQAKVPTGTTATITVTSGFLTLEQVSIAVYTFKPANIVTYSYDYNNSAGSYISVYPDTTAQSAVFAAVLSNVNTDTLAFTNGTGTTVTTVNNVEFDSIFTFRVAHFFVTTGAPSYITVTASSTPTASASRMLTSSSFGQQLSVTQAATEGLRVTEVQAPTTKYYLTQANNATLGDFALHTLPQFLTQTQTDTVNVTHSAIVVSQVITVSQLFVGTDNIQQLHLGSINLLVRLADTPRLAPNIKLLETIQTGGTPTYAIRLGPELTDTARITDTTQPKFNYIALVTEQGRVRDVAVVGVPVALSDSLQVSHALSARYAIQVLERLRLTDVLAVKSNLRTTTLEGVALTDAVRRFFGAEAVDSAVVTETITPRKRLSPLLSQAVSLTDTTARQFLLRAIAADTVELTDTQLLKMIFSRGIAEGIEIAAAYISPGNSFTTWAINAKTGAVTEYSNYAFNSFAQLGNQYIGATNTGLYELSGDDDAGTDIIAQIKSGFAQFGGSRFTSFKAAYLGMRGEGDFILKLETGDGKTYNYAVVGKNMETTKVHMGKGLRARYFAFELVSTGQDFDLDDIEFVPLVAQRRV